MGCRIYLSFIKFPRLAELKHTYVCLGCSPILLPVYYFVLIFTLNKIIYEAVGDVLPADTSCRINPQKECKLQNKSWAGGTKRFHSHIRKFVVVVVLAQCSLCGRENQEASGVVLSFWFGFVFKLSEG